MTGQRLWPVCHSVVIITPDGIDEAEIFPEAVPGRGLLVSSQKEVNFGNTVSSGFDNYGFIGQYR